MHSYFRPYAYVLAAAFVATAFLVPAAKGAEGGYSNYIPGGYGDFGMALEPPEKLTLRCDIFYYGADVDRSVRSGQAEVGAELDFFVNFTTLLYKPGVDILGAQYAFGVLVPIVHADINAHISAEGMTRGVEDDASGLGDIVLIPLALFGNIGNLHASIAQYIITPTGDYDADNLANAGLNYWSFDSNIAMTYLNDKTGQDYSFNLGHIYNTKNDDTHYQTGQEVHLDVVANQFLSETFAVGVHGFYLKQITGDSGSGAILGDFKAEALGVGPAVMWGTKFGDQDVTFIAKWLAEVDVENRLEGDHIWATVAMDW
jgi:hypothetical protein